MHLDRKAFLAIPAVIVLIALAYGVVLLVKAGQPGLAGSVLTAATTVIISTTTLVAGRYFERKRELEALHRDKKSPIYGKFLAGIYETFQNAGNSKKGDSKRILKLILEWQREITLWGGSDVVTTYNEWKKTLNNDEPNARTVFMTENLILAIRKELGHDNIGIEKGAFVQMILREADLFLTEAEKNPDITLTELSEIELRNQSNRGDAC